MKPLSLSALALTLALASPSLAHARRAWVRVEVIDISGQTAYITPGREAGLRVGNRVRFRNATYRVTAVTSSSATLALEKDSLSLGAKGRVRVRTVNEKTEGPLRATQKLANYRGQWPAPVRPATTQSPRYVPIDQGLEENSRMKLQLSTSTGGIVPLSGGTGAYGRSEIRGKLHAEPLSSSPMSIDTDAALQIWYGRNLGNTSGSRPLLRVRQLEMAYGNPSATYASLGRLRYAASTLGMLDGVRVQAAATKGFNVGAFGGFVPDPIDGTPAFAASRFGVQGSYRDDESDLRPTLDIVGHGSIYDGSMDERRLSTFAAIYPGSTRISSNLELSVFDKDNPWNASQFQISAGGMDIATRIGPWHGGARFDMRRPERSRWLASFLPDNWLCTDNPQNTTTTIDCLSNSDARYTVGADTGLLFDKWAIDAGGSYIAPTQYTDSGYLGGFFALRALSLFQTGRADLSLTANTSDVFDSYALRVGLGSTALQGDMDISAYYRPALSQYHADFDSWIEQGFGGALSWDIEPTLRVQLGADAIFGRYVDVLYVQSAAVWRPQL
ncbi:MAG: hypothetical protein IPJ88_12630 [Myxococcales bacterium]|nr:MAG: hypothetical protein IPJ88_12630 [Myxococcales bacterium]